ncbi:glycosyltransferase family 2 protein [Acinetobacter sp. SFA]|uniref:glycosyltransferase family 2 protein n=1 Tax=Acinetobacter sp. SFA TaxID=1805633 RepID=UPI0007D0B7FF|nr:glycosyltransferase family 2 protein [Acinetobacter sp. SFA]OAL82333.1 hypothetical protein AY607_12255 [Acinetobacter sp. SFA]
MSDKEKLPLISIIIPTYGRAEWLSRAIDSVLKQTYENIEIIVVNDNLLDSESYEAVIRILDKYTTNNKVKLFADGINRGGSCARNKGISLCNGEYITFLDDDDYYYENKIEKQLNHLLKMQLDVSVCNMNILKENKVITDRRSKACIGDISNFLIYGNCFTPMIFAKKEVLISVDGFAKSPRFQDHILILKMLEKKVKISVINESLFVHNDHIGERVTKNRMDSYDVRWEYEDNLIQYLNKEDLKKYKYKRLLNYTRMLRGNSYRRKAMKVHFLNIFNITELKQVYIYLRVLIGIFIK